MSSELPRDPAERKFWLDRPESADTLWHGLQAACAVTLVAALLIDLHPHFAFEEFFAFYGAFGFVAYVGLVLTAKQLRRWLMRGEDYYDPTPDVDTDAGEERDHAH